MTPELSPPVALPWPAAVVPPPAAAPAEQAGVFVSQEHLSAWREQIAVLTISLSRVQAHLLAGKPNRAQQLLDLLHSATIHMGIALEIAGAPHAPESARSLEETSGELLASATNRRLAKALQKASEAAHKVDTERGVSPSATTEVLRYFAQRVEAQSAKTKPVKPDKKA